MPAKVNITKLNSHTNATYSDGDETENYLLELFKKGLDEKNRRKILQNNPSWPVRYHLAYERQTLLGWYPFKKGARVLEVGAGCGSITESLVMNKEIFVVANELSPRRAEINAYRNRHARNLEVVEGNLRDYHPTQKFDYVICVGVFEYAGTFIEGTDNPYEEFLASISNFLKPGGVLLLAIENQLGHKYLSGAKEDHTARFYDGINDYPQKKQVRTFGRTELLERLDQAGYDSYFYYPFPDYKLPTRIYSDDYYPGKDGVKFPKSILPTPNPDQPRELTFSESAFVGVLERNKLYREFANSFLVEATHRG